MFAFYICSIWSFCVLGVVLCCWIVVGLWVYCLCNVLFAISLFVVDCDLVIFMMSYLVCFCLCNFTFFM